MVKVFAGSDGSFISAWRMWQHRNMGSGSLVLAQGDTVVLDRADDSENRNCVWYVSVAEEDLPEDVKIDGRTVRDNRTG
jgi:hypothetical protein